MATTAAADLPLRRVALGDIVQLPDGRALSVRSVAQLPQPVGPMGGFVLVGDMAALLSLPPRTADRVLVYLPLGRMPAELAAAQVACEGAARFWAPHMPARSAAMGEILYRVVTVRGRVEPVVIVYQGPRVHVFVRGFELHPDDVVVDFARRGVDTEHDEPRYAAAVVPRPIPHRDDPRREPQREPHREPQRTTG